MMSTLQVLSAAMRKAGAIRFCLAALCGLMLGVCWLQRPDGVTATAAWIMWTLILLLGINDSAWSSGRNWFAAGLGVRTIAFHWIPGVVAESFDIPYPVALLFFFLMISVESLTWLFLGVLCFHVFVRRSLSVWAVPSLVIAFDHFWPRVFPWTMAHMLIGSEVLVQVVDIGGSLGLTWLMTGVSCAIVITFNEQFPQLSPRPVSIVSQAGVSRFGFRPVVLVLLALAVIYGAWSTAHWKSLVTERNGLRVAALQVDSSFVRAEERLCELSLALSPAPDLVVWPESSLGVYSDRLEHFKDQDEVYGLSREPHCSLPGYSVPGTVLLGCGVTFADDAAPDGPYRNTSLLIDEHQKIIGKYVKRSLLPFGEYVPGQSLVPSLRHIANIDSIRECGRDSRPMVTSTGLKIGGMICYDDINPANARETVSEGAQLLTVQVNASDYDNPMALWQHCLLARLRAVENRRYFIRAAATGITCIISPWGEVISECQPQIEAIATGIVYPLDEKSIYNRVGDWPVYLSVSCLVWCVLLPLARRKRTSPEDSVNTSDT